MKILAAVVLFLTISFALTAQNAVLTWTNATQPAGVTQSGVNVYRAPCTGTVTAGTCSAEGTFVKITATPLSATAVTYTDTTVMAGASYSYYVTSLCAACVPASKESVGSNHVGIVVPSPSPVPPTLLSITSAQLLRNGANAQLIASWVDTPGGKTNWTFTAGNLIVGPKTSTSSTGNYAASWSGKISPTTSLFTFQVCNLNGCVSRVL